MKNIEKYEKTLRKYGVCFGIDKQNTIHGCEDYGCEKCIFNTSDSCSNSRLDWLLSEYKEPVLDEVEREYLRGVIRPFRDDVVGIAKYYVEEFGAYFIRIWHSSGITGSYTDLPLFEAEQMYCGMKVDKSYTLEELDL